MNWIAVLDSEGNKIYINKTHVEKGIDPKNNILNRVKGRPVTQRERSELKILKKLKCSKKIA